MSRVLGFTGREEQIVSPRKTFCSLCSKMISKGDLCLKDDETNGWYYHTDCVIAYMQGAMSNIFYRENAKKRAQKRRTRQNKKTDHTGDGKTVCSFCCKVVTADQTFVKDGKQGRKTFHSNGKNSCWIRYKRVVGATKASLS